MELEELKIIWKNYDTAFQRKEETEIAVMLKKKSSSIVERLKRTVWFELIITLIVSIGLLIYAMALPAGGLKWTSISIILLCLIYVVYYVKKLMLLNRFDPTNIRDNLISLIDNLSSYLLFYKRSYTTLYPVYFCIGLLFAGIERGADEFFNSLARPRSLVLLSLLAGVFYFLSTKFTDWYLQKLYGNHIHKLRNLLTDLQG